jgi:hypothetical protein
MADIPLRHVTVGRVLHQDADFATIEVGKHDQVEFNLQSDENGEVVGGDQFLTLIFIHQVDGAFETWVPWEDR